MFLVSAHLRYYALMALFIRPQAADTYVDQLQSCRPEILYPNLSVTPKIEILKNILVTTTIRLRFDCRPTAIRLSQD